VTEQELLDPARVPSREGVLRAAEKVAALPRTPLLPLEVDGRTIWCKAEMLQPIGAFKIRGAWHRLSDLTEDQRAKGVVGVSSGNHAQGVAWAAKRLGVAATIVMPSNAPKAKLEATRALGADVVLYDRATENRDEIAARLVAQSGGTLVHAYGDPWIIERIARGPDRIVACCGGGGLTAGLALACPEAEIWIAEPEGWDDLLNSLAAGEIVSVKDMSYPTDCDALQTPRTFPINFAVLKERVSGGTAVTPADVSAAMKLAFERLHLVVEPGGAAALAAVVSGKVQATDATVVTLSGGNVDRETFVRMIGAA
jgi:threonine dehydratase